MRFDWDPVKAWTNWLKHGIHFEDAVYVFFDPFGRTEFDPEHSENEERYRHIGMTLAGLLFVVYTIRQPDNTYRIVSARKSTRKERDNYENYKRV